MARCSRRHPQAWSCRQHGSTSLCGAARPRHVVAPFLSTPSANTGQAVHGESTPLITTCYRNRPAVAALLLDDGTDSQVVDSSRRTALKGEPTRPAHSR